MIKEIKISLLGQHPLNPRKTYDDIDELAASIKEKGILQNLLVGPDDAREGYYLVIGGNRRLLAARKAGIETAPCVIRTDLTDKDIAQIMLTENMQRRDLTPIEEAYGMQMCIQDYGIKVDEKLHAQILERYKKLDLAPYKGFINPRYKLERNAAGEVTDIHVIYGEPYDQQMLRYSRDYHTL